LTYIYKEFHLIATLGSEPQVITLGLDELLKQGEKISKVTVIHTDPKLSPINEALMALRQAFRNYAIYTQEKILLESFILRDGIYPLADVVTPHQIQQSFEQVYQFVLDRKQHREYIHLLVAGGRKTMSLFAFAVAQILFDENDHVWHLVSEDILVASKQFHVLQEEKVNLVEVPFIRWSYLPSTLQSFLLSKTPYDTLSQLNQRQQNQRYTKAQEFLKTLSRAETELVILLVNEALSNDLLAEKLGKSTRTIANQLSSIYSKFAMYYELPVNISPDRSQVIATLRGLV
jgi:CRISPR-associated protein Csx14